MKEKKKILWLSHLVPYPPKGGVLQRSYNLIKEAAKYNEIYLYAFIQGDLLTTHFNSLEEGLEVSKAELEKFCKEVVFIPIPCESSKYGKHALALKSLFSKHPYTINWLKSDCMTEALRKFRERQTVDLVHYDTISLAPYLKLFRDTPAALDHHNIESHMLLRRAQNDSNLATKFYMWQEGLKLEAYEKAWCPRFDINITCSLLDSERLRELQPKSNVIEIENGVDLGYFNAEPSPTKRERDPSNYRFIFAGRLSAYTNRAAVQQLVHDIWPVIQQKHPGFRLDVVGASPPEGVVKAAENNETITVHGFVDDVRDYITNADIYLCPITDGGGTKLKILDALAMRKAIISTQIACEGIAVEERKNVLFANTPSEYLAQVDLLVSNPELIDELGENSLSLIEEAYSYVSIGKKLSQSFDKCISADKNT